MGLAYRHSICQIHRQLQKRTHFQLSSQPKLIFKNRRVDGNNTTWRDLGKLKIWVTLEGKTEKESVGEDMSASEKMVNKSEQSVTGG